jgi:sensor histidine kinase YesM
MSISNSAAGTPGFPFRRFAVDAVYAVIFNVVCAVVITSILGTLRDFFHNLVISLCIGTIAFVLIDVARLSIWGEHGRPRWIAFFSIVIVVVPIAQYGGVILSSYLLGFQLPSLQKVMTGRTSTMLVFTLLAVGGGTLFFGSRDRVIRAEAAVAEEKARAEGISRQALQAQLQLLQAQIGPHMLFNTLANLQGLIAIDPERAQLMLDQLICYLRATLSSSRAGSTTLAQEFALMDAYLGLMAVRMGQRLTYSLVLPDALRKVTLPPMLLQPLVENAIIHGLEPNMEGGHVSVRAEQRSDMLYLSITDNGLGLAAPSGKSGTHVGLSNTRDRLRAMYGASAGLALEQGAPHGAVARLTLPLKTS